MLGDPKADPTPSVLTSQREMERRPGAPPSRVLGNKRQSDEAAEKVEARKKSEISFVIVVNVG